MNKNRALIFFAALLLICSALALPVGSQNSAPPYQNPALPLATRVDELVGGMAVEERVS